MRPNRPTKTDFQYFLNEVGTPENELRSNGGVVPDDSKWGRWLRVRDPIRFNVEFNDWVRSKEVGKP